VEQTAQSVHEAGKPLHVRVTITPDTINRQGEIAEYICKQLKPQEIHVEPVYAGDDGSQFKRDQAEEYVSAFLQARQMAQEYGIQWISSGSRPQEIHSAYCHIWRNVLNLTPEGIATACFKLSEEVAVRERGVTLGGWDEQDGRFRLDEEQIQNLRQALDKESEGCIICFNRYHCTRQCPDNCLLETDVQVERFRCQTQAMLTNSLIQETADKLTSRQNNDKILYGTITGIG
jgi:sulfatase maturation enzyme AslB (radical SAM superfamily)